MLNLILCLLITSVVMILTLNLSKKTMYDKEKTSPFECGFAPFNTNRLPFSMRFFKLTLIFLIFDIEIILILPIPMLMNYSTKMALTIIILMTIIILGLIYEWLTGALNWIK